MLVACCGRWRWPFIEYDEQICSGTLETSHVSNFITLSFLVLFIQFYRNTYLNKDAKAADKKKKK